MAREFAHLADDWRDTFDADYAHLDPIDRKFLLRRIVEDLAKRPRVPKDLRRRVFERDGMACLQCGSTNRLSLDHILPYSRGGTDTFENFQTLCGSCNSKKGAKV